MKYLVRSSITALFLTVLTACGGGSDGADGSNSLISTSPEPAGNNCEFGGTRVDAGVDSNDNGLLDSSEITATDFLCAQQASAFSGLVYTADARIRGMRELYAIADGSDTPRLLAAPAIANGEIDEIQVSPNGRYVAFKGDLETDEVFELFVIDLLNGGQPVKLNGPLVAGGNVTRDSLLSVSFQWSPDSSRIAYRADQEVDEQFELYSVFPDGTGRVKLNGTLVAGGDVTSDSFYSASFQWTPDSSRIAYRADQEVDEQFELYSVLPDGSGRRKLNGALVTGGFVFDFQWSPDSSRIAYRADQEVDNQTELYSVLPNGTDRIKLNGLLPAGGSNGGDVFGDFQWSPDSSRIAYRADQEVNDQYELYSVSPDGTGSVKLNDTLITNGDVFKFAWAPDSSRIAYIADQEVNGQDELYSVSSDGTGRVKLNGALVTGGDVGAFSWSPDSSRIAYHADQEVDDQFELYSVFPDGTGLVKLNGTLVAGGGVTIFFQWSPDSNRIAYHADQEVDDQFELYSVFPDGTGRVKLNGAMVTGGGVRVDFQWSPDSSRIAYRDGQGLYSVSPDGSDLTKRSGGGAVREFEFASTTP